MRPGFILIANMSLTLLLIVADKLVPKRQTPTCDSFRASHRTWTSQKLSSAFGLFSVAYLIPLLRSAMDLSAVTLKWPEFHLRALQWTQCEELEKHLSIATDEWSPC